MVYVGELRDVTTTRPSFLMPCSQHGGDLSLSHTQTFTPPDQQNFNVSVENMLTRCLDNQQSWRLHTGEEEGLKAAGLIHDHLPLMAKHKSDTLVFPCILSALQWICQGKDSVLADPAKIAVPVKDSITAKASPLREATGIHVLVTGSLHLVGGVLKHLDPSFAV